MRSNLYIQFSPDFEKRYRAYKENFSESVLETPTERGVADIPVQKGKRVTLLKFPRTEWVKMSIRFLDDNNLLLSDGRETKPTDFIGMGCQDGRNGRPNGTWEFIRELALGNGSTPSIVKSEREKVKKQKQDITDILRRIFQNDTDPFETEGGGVYRAKFIIEYPSAEKRED